MFKLDKSKVLTLAVLLTNISLLVIVFGKPDREPLEIFLLFAESAEKIVILCKSESKRQENK